jgi:all-trans-retinol 13,14-reductase
MIQTFGKEKFDAIVIGSGIGGLTTAAILAKLYRKKVLVLEQHFTAGGFTHEFERKRKFEWDVGLHYVGEMGNGQMGRAIFDYISNRKLMWHRMPDLMEKFIYPDLTFDVYANPQRYQADLIDKFPDERAGIRQYFRDVQTAKLWFIIHSTVEFFPAWLQPAVKKLFRRWGAIARQTTQTYLDRNFQDFRLKAVLTSQWDNYGLPPSQSDFGMHCLLVDHFLTGGWYPVGGGKAIAATIIPTIEQAGGQVITQRQVTDILIEDGVAVGVKAQSSGSSQTEIETYYASVVISNAGAFNTYLKLVPQSYPIADRSAIKDFPKGNTFLTAYLGLKIDPRSLGFQGENHWIYHSYDHDELAHSPLPTSDNPPKYCYLSFPSAKNPLAEGHTAEIMAHADYASFAQWQDLPWRRRSDDYNELKAEMTESLINLVDSHYPGFKDAIDYAELSTPLTLAYFAASDRGAAYGIPCTPARFEQSWIEVKTPIKNLYLTGSDVFCPGIMGAMIGGVKTAGVLDSSLGFFKIMAIMLLKQ